MFVFLGCFFSRKLFLDKICASHYRLAVLINHEIFVSLAKLLHAPISSNVDKITQIWWECKRNKSTLWWNTPPAKRRKLQVRIEVIRDGGIAVLLLWENTSSKSQKKKKSFETQYIEWKRKAGMEGIPGMLNYKRIFPKSKRKNAFQAPVFLNIWRP